MCFYSDVNCPSECFRPTEFMFESYQSCVIWIDNHKKYFAGSVHFCIGSIDNNFK